MGSPSHIRILIVDQSAFGRAAIPRLVEADPQIEVIGTASNVEEGLVLLEARQPDVVLLTLAPEQTGHLQWLELVMARLPRPVILLNHPQVKPTAYLSALEAGAVHGISLEVTRSSAQLMAFQSLLVSRIKAFHASRVGTSTSIPSRSSRQPPSDLHPAKGDPAAQPRADKNDDGGEGSQGGDGESKQDDARLARSTTPGKPRSPLDFAGTDPLIHPKRSRTPDTADPDRRAELVVMGTTAGGLRSFKRVLARLAPDTQLSVIGVIQLPPHLLGLAADRLSQICAVKVMVAREGEPLKPGLVQLTPAGSNLGLVRTGRIPKALTRLSKPEPGIRSTPSIDFTMRAAATVYNTHAVGIIVSGMNRDGLAGMRAMKEKGGLTAVLNYDQAIVANINRSCIDEGAADELWTEEQMCEHLARLGETL